MFNKTSGINKTPLIPIHCSYNKLDNSASNLGIINTLIKASVTIAHVKIIEKLKYQVFLLIICLCVNIFWLYLMRLLYIQKPIQIAAIPNNINPPIIPVNKYGETLKARPKNSIFIFNLPKSINKYNITKISIPINIIVDQIEAWIFLCLVFLKISLIKPLINPNAIHAIKYP